MQVTLVANVYTEDLKKLVEMLSAHGIQVTHFDIPDIVLQTEYTKNDQGELISGKTKITVIKDTLDDFLLKGITRYNIIPSLKVILNTKTGGIGLLREFF